MEVAGTGSYPLGGAAGEGFVRAGYPSARVTINVGTGATPGPLKKPRGEVESRCPLGDDIANATSVSIVLSKI
jgi:hypothetical protein